MPPLPEEVNGAAPPSEPARGLFGGGQPAPAPDDMGAEADEGSPRQASPDQQEQYDLFVYQAYSMFYGSPDMAKTIVDMLGNGDPIEGLARAASTIIIRVIQSADESGIELDNEVIWAAGTEVFGELADLAKDAGIKDFEADHDALEGAFFRACDYVRVALQESGRVVQEGAKADMARLEDMDAKGDLKAVLMNMAQADEPADDTAGGSDEKGDAPAEEPDAPEGDAPMPDDAEEPELSSKPSRGLFAKKEAR